MRQQRQGWRVCHTETSQRKSCLPSSLRMAASCLCALTWAPHYCFIDPSLVLTNLCVFTQAPRYYFIDPSLVFHLPSASQKKKINDL